ncbi:hypothetical protein LRAMOSA07535 [Lichtheimia ramosa]|uniref:SPX domain-containing protein n=1 Tax=Lichtheimia ramosa TaxID=688394 RepID=A0A077WC75_9FUNG|nr:hypothetical protein LRAMOSA07535 [Lichtheimia ramosa]
MKFAKDLANESIPEWRKAYINYKGLKKKIKLIEKYRKAKERKAAIELDRAFQGFDADSDPEIPRPAIYKTDTAATTEWRWPWNVWTHADNATLDRQPSFPHSLIRRLSSRFNNDETEMYRVPSHPASVRSSATLSVLEEVLLHASEPERQFFAMLNGELDKVSRFYNEKEQEARTKLEALKIQMQLIAEYGRRLLEVGATDPAQRPFYNDESRHDHWFNRLQPHRFSHQLPAPFQLPQLSSTVDYTADHHVSYNVARSRLKKAITEFYRSLTFLSSYKILNEKGFQKILKKFDKTAGWKASPLYTQRMKKYHWVTSEDLQNIIKETETLYINEFADGHRRRGMRKLRVPEKQEDYNSTTLRIGLFIGIAIPMLLRSLQLGFDPKTAKQLPNVETNMHIYACFSLPILFCLGFALNLVIWHKNRISYKFIFELDPRHNLDYHQFGELPSFLLLVQSIMMYIDFSQVFAPTIPSELCPLILFVILVAIMLCPFNILYCSARKWLAVALGRILLSGLFRVEFRDFFIADELNSLAYSLWTLSYFFCAYSWRWLDLESNCSISLMWYTPLIASLPPWWRLLQCLRRYRDSSELVHLANALKYTSSIVATIIGAVRKSHPNSAITILWILASLINSCYTSVWDIKMDWGLLQPSSQNLLLRDELVFHKATYYLASILDVCLRFAWVTNLMRMRLNGDILAFILAAMEACRRIQWNVFRLENEHLNNCGQYRAIKEIPLPFALNEQIKTIDPPDDSNGHTPSTNGVNGRATPPTPIPIRVESPAANVEPSWVVPTMTPSRHASSYGYESPYNGSFYGRRDFESRRDRDETSKEAASMSQPITTFENVLTRIRSFGTAGVESDGSDTEREDDDDDEDEYDEYDSNDNTGGEHHHAI